MDLGTIILINVVAISLLSIGWALMSGIGRGADRSARPALIGHIATSLAVIMAAAVSYWLLPAYAPMAALAAFGLLIAAPGILNAMIERRAMANDMAKAARLARMAAILMPTAASRFQVRVLQAMALPDFDAQVRALDALTLEADDPAARVILAMQAARVRDDWAGVAKLADACGEVPLSASILALRAFGEVGRLDDMMELFSTIRPRLSGYNLPLAQMIVAAFSGTPAITRSILSGPLRSLPAENKAFWQALSNWRKGDPSGGSELARLAKTADIFLVRKAAARHLASGATVSIPLSATSRRKLAELEQSLALKAAQRARSWRDVPATIVLLGVMLAMFAYSELEGGSENLRVLYALGAADERGVLVRGEWWRLVAALFLHYGPLHLSINGLLIGLIGSVVERRNGIVAMLGTFFTGGILSALAVVLMMRFEKVEHAVLVGASGGVFALLAFMTMQRVRDWRATRDPAARQELAAVGLILLIQFAVDIAIPEISFTAHFSGLLVGALLGLLWRRPRRLKL